MGDVPGVLPFQAFEDNVRPAHLLLKVYRLLECEDQFRTEGDLVERLRELVGATRSEDLLLVQHAAFLGLVRERADVRKADLRTAALANLLRQAIVASATAFDAFLPALLRAHLLTLIRIRGREFYPADKEITDYFKDVRFSIDEMLRTRDDPVEAPALLVTQRMLGAVEFKMLGHAKGVALVGTLLGVPKTWEALARRMGKPDAVALEGAVQAVLARRHDIVHRADRSKKAPDGQLQDITLPQAKESVDTINNVCMALHELVSERIRAFGAGGT
jgi:hypothetical protein